MTKTPNYVGFRNWDEVLAAAARGTSLFYQAPMDPRPVRVKVRRVGRASLRVDPSNPDVDPFVADRDHCDRFRQVLPSSEV